MDIGCSRTVDADVDADGVIFRAASTMVGSRVSGADGGDSSRVSYVGKRCGVGMGLGCGRGTMPAVGEGRAKMDAGRCGDTNGNGGEEEKSKGCDVCGEFDSGSGCDSDIPSTA